MFGPRAHRAAALLAPLLLLHCVNGDAGSAGPQGRLAIAVAPLSLPGVTNARYTLLTTNGDGATVWSRQLDSTAYGDGAGSLSYVGTCDADAPLTTITLDLEALFDANGEIPAASYADPTPISVQALCTADADVPVVFDMTIARAAQQGFFDVAVSFEDVFCSAKLDCQDLATGGDLNLLYNSDLGARDLTVVLGLACTGAPGGPTFLYMDDPVVTCSGFTTPVHVDAAGLGNLDLTSAPNQNPDGYLFGAAVFRGAGGIGGMAYWNISFGLDATTFAAAHDCTLGARATASSQAFPQEPSGFPLPEGSVYPVIDWSVPLSDLNGRVCTRHEVNAPAGGVQTNYVGYLPALNQFTWSPDPITLQHRYDAVQDQIAGSSCLGDADHDGVCDDVDRCPGADDALNQDGDAYPDGCDMCPADPTNACGLPDPGAFAHVVNVATWGSDATGDGSTAAPYASVHVAIDAAVAGDGVRIWPGVYQTPGVDLNLGYASAPIWDRGKTLHIWGANENTVLEYHAANLSTTGTMPRDGNLVILQGSGSTLSNLTLRYWPSRPTNYNNAIFAWHASNTVVRNVLVENMSTTNWAYSYDNSNTGGPYVYNSVFVSHGHSQSDYSGAPHYTNCLFENTPSAGTKSYSLTRTTTIYDRWAASIPADLQNTGDPALLNLDTSRSHIGTGGGIYPWDTPCPPDGSLDSDGDGHPDHCDPCPADPIGDRDGDGLCG